MHRCLLLVGTFPFREYVVDEVAQIAENLGLELLLVDREGKSALHDIVQRKITAPIGDQSDTSEQQICERVAAYCDTRISKSCACMHRSIRT